MAYFNTSAFSGKIERYHDKIVGAGTGDLSLMREIDHYVREFKEGPRYNRATKKTEPTHEPIPLPEEIRAARFEIAARLAGLFDPAAPWGIGEYDTVEEAAEKIAAAVAKGGLADARR